MENILSGKIQITAPNVQKAFDDVSKGVAKAQTSLKNLAPVTNNASQTLLNFGRIAQDAPFGIIGITNNINPLVESFQRLKVSTGSTGLAFKSLIGSLAGPAGIGIAVSIATSLLTAFSLGMFKTKKAADDTKDSLQNLAAGFADQAVKLTVLVGIVQNSASSYDNKKRALQALNQEFAKHDSNLTKEKISLENIAIAYEKIIDSMIRQAVVKGLQEEISKAVEKTAKSLISLHLARERERTAADEAAQKEKTRLTDEQKVQRQIDNRNRTIKDGVIAQTDYKQSIVSTVGALNNFEATEKRVKDELMATLAPLLKLTTSFDDLGIKLNEVKKIQASFEFTPVTGNPFKEFIEKLALSPQAAFKIPISAEIVPQVQIDSTQKNLQTALDFFSLKANVLQIPLTISKIPLGLLKELQENAKATAETISGILTPAFDGFIGAIISGQDPIKAFLNALLQGIQQAISAFIAATIKAFIFKTVLNLATGGLGAALPGLPGGAGLRGGQARPGNISYGGQAVRVNLSGGFQLRGNDLLLAVSRTQASQGRTG